MPPKKKQRFSSLLEQEQAIQDFLDNMSDEDAPFDEDVPFEESDEENENLAPIPETDSEGEEGDQEYEQLPKKQIFKSLDECTNEGNYKDLAIEEAEDKKYIYTSSDKKFTRTWHTKKEKATSGRAAGANIVRGAEGP